MSLQALMALLGHVTPQMTIRYATLASPALRTAYDEAMGKMRRQFTLTPAGQERHAEAAPTHRDVLASVLPSGLLAP